MGGEDEFSAGGFCHFPWEGSFQGVNFSGKFTLGEFAIIPIRNFLYVLLSLYRFNFTRGDVKVIIRGKFSPGLNCPEDISYGEGDFSVEVEPGILVLFKKRSEIKQKNGFSTESKEQH